MIRPDGSGLARVGVGAVRLTADTITDEQIRELYDSTDAYTESHDAAYAALGGRGHHRGSRSTAEALGEQLAARARCAEILNARGAKP